MSAHHLKGKATKFVDIDNSRKEDQRAVMQEIIDQGHCPFCLNNLSKYHKQEILFDGKFWLLTKNQWPYENTKEHFLIIYKQHIESFVDLEPDAGREFFEILAFAERKFKLPGGGVGMRFGDTVYSAATVRHLHAQLILPDVEAPDYKPTRFKIGKSRSDQ